MATARQRIKGDKRAAILRAATHEFSDRAFPDYPGTTSRQRWHRDLLRRAMEAEDFAVYEEEWWHYDYKDWKKYPILNKTFEELK